MLHTPKVFVSSLDLLHQLLPFLFPTRTLLYSLVEDKAVAVVIKGEAVVMAVEIQVVVEDCINMVIAADKIINI